MKQENPTDLIKTTMSGVVGEGLKEYSEIRHRLVLELLGAGDNTALMKDYPYFQLLDLVFICRIQEYKYADCETNPIVSHEMLERWNIAEPQLFQDAFRSASLNKPPMFRNIADVLEDLTDSERMTIAKEQRLYIATVREREKGACVIAYPGFLDSVAAYIGGNYYVIPSSIHEVLILPEVYAPDVSELNKMIQQINEMLVDPADRLSNQVYHFDAMNGELETGYDYLLRTDADRNRQIEP